MAHGAGILCVRQTLESEAHLPDRTHEELREVIPDATWRREYCPNHSLVYDRRAWKTRKGELFRRIAGGHCPVLIDPPLWQMGFFNRSLA